MKKRGMLFLLIVATIITISSLAFAKEAEYKDLKPISVIPLEEIPDNLEGQKHILLLCVDQWNGDANNLGNTDGMLLLTLDGRSERAMITTFSRDMLVIRPDGLPGRITYIAKNSGPEALCQVISQHFGVKVDQYILFDMKQVENIVQVLGGVNITITEAEAGYLNRYPLSPGATQPEITGAGTYLFDGHSSVIYMRIRKVGGLGEVGRTERMRRVLGTLVEEVKEITLQEAKALLSTVTDNTTKTNVSLLEMLEWLDLAMGLKGATLEGIQMPVDEGVEPVIYAGMSVKEVDFELCRKALYDFFDKSFVVVDD